MKKKTFVRIQPYEDPWLLKQNPELVRNLQERIVTNAVLCKLCNSTVFSNDETDVSCSCNNVTISGGLKYLKRTVNVDSTTWIDISTIGY